jgi:two-component system alkaline phosphatase synthesis response regulator PhoP
MLGEMIRDNLVLEGYGAELVRDGEQALARIRRGGIDLVILDVMMPKRDGFSVLQQIRQDGNQVPVLILSARSRDQDRILGFELHADDYLIKPFHLKELLLRVRALLRRARSGADAGAEQLVVGSMRIDFRGRAAHKPDGSTVPLTESEARVLRLLAGRSGEVVARREILATLFGGDTDLNTRTLDNLIVRLRRILEDDPRVPRWLHTVRGIGYRLTPETP